MTQISKKLTDKPKALNTAALELVLDDAVAVLKKYKMPVTAEAVHVIITWAVALNGTAKPAKDEVSEPVPKKGKITVIGS